MLNSSNPALANGDIFHQQYGRPDTAAVPQTATVAGVVNKTSLLVGLAIVAGFGGYAVGWSMGWGVMAVSAIAAFLIAMAFFWLMRGKPHLAMYFAFPYALIEGFFLGALTCALDSWLLKAGYTPALTGDTIGGGLAFQAFLITISVVLAMIAAYHTGLIKPTKTFIAVVSVLTMGVMITYMFGFVLGLFGMHIPYLSLNSAFQGGSTAWIGLGLNAAILVLASLWLVIDFKLIDDNVRTGAPKYMEWYCAFSLLVTLAWIYFEAVKLAFRLAIIFGGRE